jgi:hypothetical protein
MKNCISTDHRKLPGSPRGVSRQSLFEKDKGKEGRAATYAAIAFRPHRCSYVFGRYCFGIIAISGHSNSTIRGSHQGWDACRLPPQIMAHHRGGHTLVTRKMATSPGLPLSIRILLTGGQVSHSITQTGCWSITISRKGAIHGWPRFPANERVTWKRHRYLKGDLNIKD